MSELRHLKSALISVFHKDGLEPIVDELKRLGVTIYSTGGTQAAIEAMGAEVVPVESVTDYPSILGGRVKTLHPKVFGGILNRRNHEGDQAQMAEYNLPNIDLVVVDLYPFEATVASGASEADIVEKIDIGGIALIRGAAKNFNDVVIVPSMDDYGALVDVLKRDGATTLEERKAFAARGFRVSSHYDTMIHAHLSGTNLEGGSVDILNVSVSQSRALRYGENPHQAGQYFGDLDNLLKPLARQGLVVQQPARCGRRGAAHGGVPRRRPHFRDSQAQQRLWMCHTSLVGGSLRRRFGRRPHKRLRWRPDCQPPHRPGDRQTHPHALL